MTSENLPVVDPFNRENPRAIINLVTQEVQNCMLAAYAARPDLFGLEERDFLKAAKCGIRGMGPTSNALRMKFWYEYDEAQMDHKPLRMAHLHAGICEPIVFYKKLKDPIHMAWMLTRPMSYEIFTEEMHHLALTRLRSTLDLEPYTEGGKFDSKLAEAQIKIFQTLDTRVKGAVVQKTLNLHAKAPGKPAISDSAKKEALEERIRELERNAEKQQGKIIDARVVDAE